MTTYPYSPGYKGNAETGRLAAEKIAPRVNALQQSILDLLADRPFPMTADDMAGVLGENILRIRPRVSELNKMGFIEDSGYRGTSSFRNSAVKWRLAS